MKNKIVAALVFSVIFAGTSVVAYNAQNVANAKVIENDLHPSEGTPTLFKAKTPVYSNKKLTGKPHAYIKAGTVVRSQSKTSMIYNGLLVYFNSKNTIQGDNLTEYASKHATEFDKLISTNKSTKLYSVRTYKPCATVSKDTSFLITGEDSDFYTVSYDDHSALIYKKDADEQIYVKVASYNDVQESLSKIYADLQKLADSLNLDDSGALIDISSEAGSEIVEYAKQFVGNPYVWGGTSLTDGCDCSGFVQQIYAHYGITLPRCSADQSLTGTQVSVEELQPGDLLYFYRGSRIGHVEMYAGNGMVVHAKGSKYGIVYEQLHEKPAVCRRYLEDKEIEK